MSSVGVKSENISRSVLLNYVIDFHSENNQTYIFALNLLAHYYQSKLDS